MRPKCCDQGPKKGQWLSQGNVGEAAVIGHEDVLLNEIAELGLVRAMTLSGYINARCTCHSRVSGNVLRELISSIVSDTRDASHAWACIINNRKYHWIQVQRDTARMLHVQEPG